MPKSMSRRLALYKAKKTPNSAPGQAAGASMKGSKTGKSSAMNKTGKPNKGC